MPSCRRPPANFATRSPISRQLRRRAPSTVAMPLALVCNTRRRPWVTFIDTSPSNIAGRSWRLLSADHTGEYACRKRAKRVLRGKTRGLAGVGDYRHPAGQSGRLPRSQETIGAGYQAMGIRRIGVIIGALLAFAAALSQVLAQENFPSRSIRIVIPYSPGSVADVFARIVAQNMQEQWKGTIVIESKSGANGSIAAEEVARAAPDGYTWLLATTFFVAGPSLSTSLRWDPQRDFTAVGEIC